MRRRAVRHSPDIDFPASTTISETAVGADFHASQVLHPVQPRPPCLHSRIRSRSGHPCAEAEPPALPPPEPLPEPPAPLPEPLPDPEDPELPDPELEDDPPAEDDPEELELPLEESVPPLDESVPPWLLPSDEVDPLVPAFELELASVPCSACSPVLVDPEVSSPAEVDSPSLDVEFSLPP